MSPTSGGVGFGLCLKHLRVFLALTALQIFTAFDRWRQSQAKALICFCEWPAPQGDIVRGYWRRGELLDGNMDVSLPQQVISAQPHCFSTTAPQIPHASMARRSWG